MASARFPLIIQHWPKPRLGQLTRRGGDERMPQQTLRGQHDERQRIGQEQRRLTPQQMEVLPCARTVGDPDVRVRGELQEAFGAC